MLKQPKFDLTKLLEAHGDSGKGAEDTGAKVDDPEKGDALGAGAEKQEEGLGA